MAAKCRDEDLGGTEQSLYAGGILAACAASISTKPEWLHGVLINILGQNGLRLRVGAIQALREQAREISSSENRVKSALEVVDSYLISAQFPQGAGVKIVAIILSADVAASTAYDSRTREMLLRVLSALELPPRILYNAEMGLAALVDQVNNSSEQGNGTRAEDVEEDRKRRNRRWLKIGGASLVGGIALGVSGGLLAPAILPALTTVGLASAAAPLTALGSGGAVALGGIFGITGASIGGAAMANRTGGVEEFQFEKCTVLDDGSSRASVFEYGQVTPSNKILEVKVPVPTQGHISGGLLAWEYITSQKRAM